ncbi:hypothetical protein BV25DRAFT_1863361 [Artomyces pyxidatus]|uniref:Uncharacterized protein n=1 Tax=Artomyces pyxidatus TaxID=48021 RepID=A0ACB8SLZ3_9AGAM|nr:hypothetical protein BV25DRAFT_1863361 [Artomyces pyxidatus]
MASLEPRRTMISTGLYPARKLQDISFDRPFTHQIDLVFPSDPQLEAAFRSLETRFYTSTASLVEVFDAARDLEEQTGPLPDTHALSTDRCIPDVWCLARGVLGVNVTKEVYESLGLQGSKLADVFTGCSAQYSLSLGLYSKNGNTRSPAFIRDALAKWDRTRAEAGQGPWDFAFYLSSPENATGPFSPSLATPHTVAPVIRKFSNVHIPTPTLLPRPQVPRAGRPRHDGMDVDEDPESALEDWNEDMGELFEWLGMANMGAQRLQANDRVDPYVAVYTPPQPSMVGEITHIRWRGLLPPSLVQKIVGTAVSHSANSSTPTPSASARPFIGLTVHGTSHAPVPTPHRIPRPEGEDTVALILAPEEGLGEAVVKAVGGEQTAGRGWSVQAEIEDVQTKVLGRWAMVEAVGKWNARFG